MKVFLLLLTLLISHVSWSQIDLLRSSDLPIISIDTRGQTIIDEPKITARIQIRDRVGKRNTPQDTPVFETEMGIELRGSTSQFLFPQKPYSIQFYDSAGQDFNVSVMGMPEEHDWILYAPYNDKTCLRNVLSYELANRMGMYAPRTKYCELLLNGEYLGIYVWMEKIKRDRNRVDIARLNPQDTSGSELTGAYIFKIDKVNGLFTGG